MSWRSIDESEPVVVLRGLKPRHRRPPFSLALFLERVIAWSGALAAHLFVAALLVAIWVEFRRDNEDGLVSVSLHRGRAGEKGDLVKAPEPPKPEPEPKPEPKPEPEPKPKPEPEPEPEPTPEPAPPAPPPAPEAPPKAPAIGGGASAAPPAPPAPPAGGAVSDKEVERDPSAALARKRAGDLDALRRGGEQDIVVVSGIYDDVEAVLERLAVPHRVVDYERLATLDLSRARVLLVNCHLTQAAYLFGDLDTRGLEKQIALLALKVDDLQRRFDAATSPRAKFALQTEALKATSSLESARQKLEALRSSNRVVDTLRRFVEGGGYLFTSDWGMSLIERAFPGWVKNGGNVGPKKVSISSGKAAAPLLEGVFYEGGKSKRFLWEIDSQSYLIKVESPKVETLVDSGDLPRHPAVAVAFAPAGEKGGKVLHILSHFKNQATKQGDYALQSLLLNFLLERMSRP